jgi:hypothetical protein
LHDTFYNKPGSCTERKLGEPAGNRRFAAPGLSGKQKKARSTGIRKPIIYGLEYPLTTNEMCSMSCKRGNIAEKRSSVLLEHTLLVQR